MSPASRQQTAFSTPGGGQFQFRVMPFGLKNAPGAFQNLMRQVLEEQWGTFAIAYLDDIIVYSRDWDEHLLHLALVFERLSIYGLTAAPQKCSFGQTTLPYLGHMISTDGNSAQTTHIQAICNASPPRTRKEMRSFLGVCNWVKEYVPNSSVILAPLSDLLSTKRPYKMTPEKLQHFEAAKLAFQNPRTLSRPDPSQRFILQTDASARGMGALIMQEERARVPSSGLADKTLSTVSRGSFPRTVEHVPGKINELPDALSRHPDPQQLSPGEPDMEQMLPPTRQTDSAITRDVNRWREIRDHQLRNAEEESLLSRHRLDEFGFWKRGASDGKWRLPVAQASRPQVLWEYHDAPLSGHPGADVTIRAIQTFFFWPGMNREIHRYVSGSHICICSKPMRARIPDTQSPRIDRRAWETVAVNLMGPYPRTRYGNHFILVVTDLFTRWVEAFPLRASDAPRLTIILEEDIFARSVIRNTF
ncbi:uncharacterized protein LOC117173800 [Belonocnema kinseyi]|uniref:uncharacterized protein LOC117173800 n=1 Tax=Belonocnema kinseyi TaxID=2817044 RepID=UPI00143D114D|nr:uncharacterized protein LOC117173800 [Belonocnema kinseyi]